MFRVPQGAILSCGGITGGKTMLRIGVLAALLFAPAVAFAEISNGDDDKGRWSTRFDRIPQEVSQKWRCGRIFIDVPRSLTVSEEETWAPEADIVWRGDPPGDRYVQVHDILETAFEGGVGHLKGPRRVDFYVTAREFHSLTDKARYQLTRSGVHNIEFDVVVRDRRSGEQIGPKYTINADLPALNGKQARQADAEGHTQKVRVTNYLTNVVYSWLGYGVDQRRSFNRAGR